MWVILFESGGVRAPISLELIGLVAARGDDVDAFIVSELAAYNKRSWKPIQIYKAKLDGTYSPER